MPDAPMKALSIMQPWAWLITAGHKDIENRNWQPKNPGLRFRGRFLIHAGLKFDFDPNMDWDWDDITPDLAAMHTGGIVGEAEIVDVVKDSLSPWFHGPYGLVIRNARPLPFRPCRGMLGFFARGFTPAAPKAKRETPQGKLL